MFNKFSKKGKQKLEQFLKKEKIEIKKERKRKIRLEVRPALNIQKAEFKIKGIAPLVINRWPRYRFDDSWEARHAPSKNIKDPIPASTLKAAFKEAGRRVKAPSR